MASKAMDELEAKSFELIQGVNYVVDRVVTLANARRIVGELEAQLEQRWQPIETAPKDGTMIDVWQIKHWSQFKNPDGSRSSKGETIKARRLENVCWLTHGWDFWGEDRAGWSFGFKNFVITDDSVITHWMPIPAPPEESK